MHSQTLTFYLTRNGNITGLQNDFNTILSQLGTIDNIRLAKSDSNSVVISYSQTLLTAQLGFNQQKTPRALTRTTPIILTCDPRDNVTINLLRNIVGGIGYRIYNPLIGSFLVNDPYLLDLSTVSIEPKVSSLFDRFSLLPLFQLRDSHVFFAKYPHSEPIHLVNNHLLEHLLTLPDISVSKTEFSVKIADSISLFVAMYDRGLISTNFYKNCLDATKVINRSGFNSQKVGADLLITPLFFELDKLNQSFIQREFEKAPPISRVKKTDSFELVAREILKNTLDTTNFLAIKIPSQIEFHHTKKTKLTPQLSLSIFLETII